MSIPAAPCPFCGSDSNTASTTGTIYVECSACGALGPIGMDEQQALWFWKEPLCAEEMREACARVARLRGDAWRDLQEDSTCATSLMDECYDIETAIRNLGMPA